MDVTLHLNARLQPKHRFELEDLLQELLEAEGLGEVTGGGTLQGVDGEIRSCDIEIALEGDDGGEGMERLAALIGRLRIPKGSALVGSGAGGEECRIGVGRLEGLAFYSNGTELPEEVYRTCDINHVIERMEEAMEGIGSLFSYWEGAEETALYFYGESFDEMRRRIEPFVATYPLCRKSRIVRIA